MTTTTDPLLNPLDKRKSVSISELAEALGVDSETVLRELKDGTIPGGFQRKSGGAWRIRRSTIEKWWALQGK